MGREAWLWRGPVQGLLQPLDIAESLNPESEQKLMDDISMISQIRKFLILAVQMLEIMGSNDDD
jgi:hypothetical protein